MPSYYWKNKTTEEVVIVERSIGDIDRLPDSIDNNDRDNWFRLIQKPAVLKRHIPDGFGIRQKDGAWADGKEIAALEDSTLDMRHDDPTRKEIRTEVNVIKESHIK